MKEKSSALEMIKLGLILSIYACISCTVLAAVNNVTSVQIEKNNIVKANNAMKTVMPDADAFEEVKDFAQSSNASIKILSLYAAKKNGEIAGAVAKITGPTYDKATLMVGLSKDSTVTGISFLELSDSPGFGLKANDSTFILPNGKTFAAQFEGKNAKEGFICGETYDAISGSTITSRGVGALIEESCKSMQEFLGRTE